ncbi:MAG: hypothetical protein KTR16_14225 [Acidiferrobacterales bacterium]|nr:hypothetical protein [Acidiferrobacterales bacterium]
MSTLNKAAACAKYTAAWLIAAMVASISVSLTSTQQVLGELQAVGASVAWSDRASMSFEDLAILQTLLPVMLVCFLVGFIVASLCHRYLQGSRTLWFMIAGASSIVCTILLMQSIMNLMPIAGARTLLGLALIAVSGALGGYVFSRLIGAKPATR